MLAITMTGPLTGQFEVAEIKNKSTKYTEQVLDHALFSRYLRPVQCTHNNGNEFFGKDF